jgi:hypothetical protein
LSTNPSFAEKAGKSPTWTMVELRLFSVLIRSTLVLEFERFLMVYLVFSSSKKAHKLLRKFCIKKQLFGKSLGQISQDTTLDVLDGDVRF